MNDTPEPGWSRAREMTELESTMWRANKHPANSTQGGVLQVLSGTPDFAELRAWHVHGIKQFPRFREKVVTPAVPVGPPVWVEDPGFDVDYHLRRLRLPGSGTMRDLLDACQIIAATPLDPTRPPWMGTFIEGLEGGRSAYYLVVNHCLMDGFGSVQLLSGLHTAARLPDDATLSGVDDLVDDTGALPPSALLVAGEQARDRLLHAPRLIGKAAATAWGATKAGPRRNAEFVASMARVMKPAPVSTSPLFSTGSREKWRYGVVDLPLADMKAAGKAVGGTVNDVYVAGILGGLRAYHEKRGLEMGDITINMPVSMRSESDAQGGNKFAAAFLQAPGSIADPAERMRAVRAMAEAAGNEPALDIFSLVLPVLNRGPAGLLTPLFTTMQNRTDLTISNVPGATKRGAFVGHDVDAIYYFGPLPGSPVMAVLHSHLGTCHIGLNVDGEVFDVDDVVACVSAGLEEVVGLAAAGDPT